MKRLFYFLFWFFILLSGCAFNPGDFSNEEAPETTGSFNPLTGAFSPYLYYGRSLLTKEEQAGYDFILKAFLTQPATEEEKSRTQIIVQLEENGFSLTEAQVVKIFDFICKDEPRMALLTSSVIPRRSPAISDTYDSLGENPAKTAYFDNAFKGMTLGTFWETYHKPQTEEMEEHIAPILESVKEGMTTAQKVRAIHDAFLATVAYGTINSRGDGNLRGAFLNPLNTPDATVRRVVCQGYAVSFQYLLMRCGIPAITVTGTALSTPGDPETKGSHAWNKVCIDGKWYLCDPTHDDSLVWNSDSCIYNYFLKADSSVPTHEEGILPDGSKTGYPVFPKTGTTDYPLKKTEFRQ